MTTGDAAVQHFLWRVHEINSPKWDQQLLEGEDGTYSSDSIISKTQWLTYRGEVCPLRPSSPPCRVVTGMALTLVSFSAARSPRHCDWLHTTLWVTTDQLSQYTLPFHTCLCKVDNITQIMRYVAFVLRTGNHRSRQRSTGEDLPRPDSPVCKLMWRYVLNKLITRSINVQNNFLKIWARKFTELLRNIYYHNKYITDDLHTACPTCLKKMLVTFRNSSLWLKLLP